MAVKEIVKSVFRRRKNQPDAPVAENDRATVKKEASMKQKITGTVSKGKARDCSNESRGCAQNYRLPPLTVVSPTPQALAGAPKTAIGRLGSWHDMQDFTMEILSTLDLSSVAPPKESDSTTMRVKTQWDVELAMYFSAFSKVERMLNCVGKEFEGVKFVHPTSRTKMVGHPSAVLLDKQGHPALLCVVDPPWVCTNLTTIDLEELDADSSSGRLIHKLLAYMMLNNVKYGVLSNYEETRILRLRDDRVDISPSIHSDSLGFTVVGAIMAAAVDALRSNRMQPFTRVLPIVSPASQQIIDELTIVSTGLSVTTLQGEMPCRTKIADYTRPNSTLQSLIHESQVYTYLRAHQGKLVPRSILTGTVWGVFKILVLECFSVLTMDKITERVFRQMQRLVEQLHNANVCHHALTVRSFAIVQSCVTAEGEDVDPSQLRIVGLERAKLNPRREDKRHDLEALRSIGVLSGISEDVKVSKGVSDGLTVVERRQKYDSQVTLVNQ